MTDAVGLIPVVGEAADGINAVIFYAREDYVNSALSAASMIPFAGWAATSAKLGGKAIRTAVDLTGAARVGARGADNVVGAARGVRGADNVAGVVKANIPSKNLSELPQNIQNSFNQYNRHGWQGNVSGQTPGTRAGAIYNNTPDKISMELPRFDTQGNAITYREFDINNRMPGADRGLNGLFEAATVQCAILTTTMERLQR